MMERPKRLIFDLKKHPVVNDHYVLKTSLYIGDRVCDSTDTFYSHDDFIKSHFDQIFDEMKRRMHEILITEFQDITPE